MRFKPHRGQDTLKFKRNSSMQSLVRHHDVAGQCRLSRLDVCFDCGKLQGTILVSKSSTQPVTEFHQRCECRIDAKAHPNNEEQSRRLRLDFPQMFDLCHCCGRNVICSGSRLSWLFCRDCRPAIEAINDQCQHCVIPVGRHTFMAARWGRQSFERSMQPPSGTLQDDSAEYQMTLKRQLRRNMRIWSERINRVSQFGRQMTATHLSDILSNNTRYSKRNRMPLRTYLETSFRSHRTQVRCFRGLGHEFLVPYQIVLRVALQHRLATRDFQTTQSEPTARMISWNRNGGQLCYGFAHCDDLKHWQQLETAMQTSQTWKDFRARCPAQHRQAINQAFYHEGIPEPHGSRRFTIDELPEDLVAKWRPRPGQSMLHWMPSFLVEEFGSVLETGYESLDLQFGLIDMQRVAQLLETRYGFRVVHQDREPFHISTTP